MRVMKQQRGAAIIAVMLVLLVITVLGITGVRMGLTSLTIATNSQVNALMFQAADTGLVEFEKEVNADPQAAGFVTGAIGPALNAPGIEMQLCSTVADRLRAGGCSAGVAADYSSERGIALTQMAVRVPAGATGDPMKAQELGSDMNRAGVATFLVNLHSTTVVPVLGAADANEINACLVKPSNDDDDPAVETVTDCLTDEGAIFTTMVQEYNYGLSKK